MTSADSCRMGGIEGVGTVELEYVGRLLRMGCDFLLMPVSGSVGSGKPPWEQNGLPWKHFVEKQWGAGERRQIYSVLLGRNCCVKTMGRVITR